MRLRVWNWQSWMSYFSGVRLFRSGWRMGGSCIPQLAQDCVPTSPTHVAVPSSICLLWVSLRFQRHQCCWNDNKVCFCRTLLFKLSPLNETETFSLSFAVSRSLIPQRLSLVSAYYILINSCRSCCLPMKRAFVLWFPFSNTTQSNIEPTVHTRLYTIYYISVFI